MIFAFIAHLMHALNQQTAQLFSVVVAALVTVFAFAIVLALGVTTFALVVGFASQSLQKALGRQRQERLSFSTTVCWHVFCFQWTKMLIFLIQLGQIRKKTQENFFSPTCKILLSHTRKFFQTVSEEL